MKLTDTKITYAGVYRCCIDLLDAPEEVEAGDEAKCGACGRVFRLQGDVWLPVDFIERGIYEEER